MQIVPLDPHDDHTAESLFTLFSETKKADRPDMPALPKRLVFGQVRNPRPGHANTYWGVWDDARLVGVITVMLPMTDNRSLAMMRLEVHPDYRRRGIGSKLWEQARGFVRENGRTTALMSTSDTVPGGVERSQSGKAFAKRHGFSLALQEEVWSASVTHLDPAVENELSERARLRAEGYELLRWTGTVPAEQREPMLRLDRMLLTEVPTGDIDFEEEQIDLQRSKDRAAFRQACGIELAQTAARDIESGLLVGHTMFMVYPEPATHAFQGITLIDKQHRGKGLGTLLKIENLRLLRHNYPRITEVETGTASENTAMNAINQKLGYASREIRLNYQVKL